MPDYNIVGSITIANYLKLSNLRARPIKGITSKQVMSDMHEVLEEIVNKSGFIKLGPGTRPDFTYGGYIFKAECYKYGVKKFILDSFGLTNAKTVKFTKYDENDKLNIGLCVYQSKNSVGTNLSWADPSVIRLTKLYEARSLGKKQQKPYFELTSEIQKPRKPKPKPETEEEQPEADEKKKELHPDDEFEKSIDDAHKKGNLNKLDSEFSRFEEFKKGELDKDFLD